MLPSDPQSPLAARPEVLPAVLPEASSRGGSGAGAGTPPPIRASEPPIAWMAGLGLVAAGLLSPGLSAPDPSAPNSAAALQDPPITGPQITQSLPIRPPAYATGDSNGRMIAVTGVDITGSSVLYLIDTESQQLACYQATGGGNATNGVKLIGARKIDLDLQLIGFNDKSEVSYEELERNFKAIDRKNNAGD